MNPAKVMRFADADRFFRCPLCHTVLQLEGTSLICVNRHCFDIAKQGYVNLAPTAKQSQYYDRASFEHRHTILRKGYYDHIAHAIAQEIAHMQPSVVLDVGCGEGYYARHTASEQPSCTVLAFDIAKESVQLAARYDTDNKVRWFVGNLADLPIRDQSVDCILDIFSPTNTSEFLRVLKSEGTIIKVVPGARHDIELREAAREQLRHDEYDNDSVVSNFAEHFKVVERRVVTQTFDISLEDLQIFAKMTPLLFHVEPSSIDLESITQLTIEAEILIGKAR